MNSFRATAANILGGESFGSQAKLNFYTKESNSNEKSVDFFFQKHCIARFHFKTVAFVHQIK